MYTIESLSAINPAYCYKHRVTQADVDNVNHMVECIEKARANVSTPMEGDIIHYTDRYGMYYRNALLVKLDEFGDGKAEICFAPFGTSVSEQNGAIHVSASGGPFGHHQPEDFIYEGFEKRRFSIWGSCGPSESGCVEFEARVISGATASLTRASAIIAPRTGICSTSVRPRLPRTEALITTR